MVPIWWALKATHTQEWGTKEKAAFKSQFAGCQWAEARCYAVGLAPDDKCDACFARGRPAIEVGGGQP